MAEYVFALVLPEKPPNAEDVVTGLTRTFEYMGLGGRIVHGDIEDELLTPPLAASDTASDKQIWFLNKLIRQANDILGRSTGDEASDIACALAPAEEYTAYARAGQSLSKALCSQLIDALKGALDR